MKIFECGNCAHPLYFENASCEKCGHLAGFSIADLDIRTFQSANYPLSSDIGNQQFKYCKNHQYEVCNWLIPFENPDEFCLACSLNRMIPDLSDYENFEKWKKLESAKHRLVYQLLRLRLFIPTEGESGSLKFDFISKQGNDQIMTGHKNGLITILLSEADSVHREYMRKQMSEQYRTLIGHFRHEVGHFFWDQLIAPYENKLADYRKIFGDERADYGAALKNHYQNGPTPNWQQNYISSYAGSHPWEDWAETWAHYLHIMDMAETAFYFGMSVSPKLKDKSLQGSMPFDPYGKNEFQEIIEAWTPVSFAINSLNRSMGLPDVYPFVLSPNVVDKIKFIHQLVVSATTS